MVDRYVLPWSEQTYHGFSQRDLIAFWKDHYNIRFGMSVPVIADNDPTKLRSFVFGITDKQQSRITTLPCDAYIDNSGASRAPGNELLRLIATNRCIVPALGFYVIPQLKKKRLHYCFTEFGLFSFAGIWLNESTSGNKYAFCLLSVKGRSILSLLGHSSSPVILKPEQEKLWLDPKTSHKNLVPMLKPLPEKEMNAWPVGDQVLNSTQNSRSFIMPRGGFIQTFGWPVEPLLGTNRFLCAKCCLNNDLKRFVSKRARVTARCNICCQRTKCIPVDGNIKLIKLFRVVHRLTFQDIKDRMAYFRSQEGDYLLGRGVYESENTVLKNTAFRNFQKRAQRSYYKSNNRVESAIYLLEYLLGRSNTGHELSQKYLEEKSYFELPLHLHPKNFIKETEELLSDNRIKFSFSAINQVKTIIQNVISKKIITRKVNFQKTRFYRARMGCDKGGYIGGKYVERWPFFGTAIGPPPPELATQGRLNAEGVPILYLASDADTAISEIRPEPGAYVSVGAFKSVVPDLNVIDLRDIDLLHFFETEEDLVAYFFLRHISEKLCAPVLSNTINRYRLTQLLSQCVAEAGYDGVLYRSALTFGYNLAVFDSAKFKDIEEEACLHYVSKVQHYHSVLNIEQLRDDR